MNSNKITDFFEALFGKEYIEEDEPEPDSIKLDGPFLPKGHAIKYCKLYASILKETVLSSNLFINRRFLILSDDDTYSKRDNERFKLNILPNNHLIEISANNNMLHICCLDDYILLNCNDIMKLRKLLEANPPTITELLNIRKP